MHSGSYLQNQFARPLVSAAVGAASLRLVMGPIGLEVGQRKIPVTYLGAGLGFASTFISEFVQKWVIAPTTRSHSAARSMESLVVAIGTSAGAFAIIPRVFNQDISGGEYTKLLAAGAATEIVGDYAFRMLTKM